jgi:hypothetical protein
VKTMVPIDLPIEKQTFCSHRATVVASRISSGDGEEFQRL